MLPREHEWRRQLSRAIHDLRQRGYSAWSIRTSVAAFQSCWTFAGRDRGWCDEAVRPKAATVTITGENSRKARRLNEAQLHDLVQGATDQGRALVAVLVYTRLRLSEALALTWADVDMVDGKISVNKQMGRTGSPRRG